jgi:hypothetical protein
MFVIPQPDRPSVAFSPVVAGDQIKTRAGATLKTRAGATVKPRE